MNKKHWTLDNHNCIFTNTQNRLCLSAPNGSQNIIYSIIGIKHGFSRINIRQVPREVLKTEAVCDRYYCIKSENVCYISLYFLHYFFFAFSPMSHERIFYGLVLGPGSTYIVTAANLWPRYDHIESCVDVLCPPRCAQREFQWSYIGCLN